MLRKALAWIARREAAIAKLPPVLNALVTSSTHFVFAIGIAVAWGGGSRGFAAATTAYGLREADQLRKDYAEHGKAIFSLDPAVRPAGVAPWYDRVADIAAPVLGAGLVWLL